MGVLVSFQFVSIAVQLELTDRTLGAIELLLQVPEVRSLLSDLMLNLDFLLADKQQSFDLLFQSPESLLRRLSHVLTDPLGFFFAFDAPVVIP